MKLASISDAIGKTLVGFTESKCDRHLLLAFNDGVVCQVTASAYYGGDDPYIDDDHHYDHRNYKRDELLRLGVVDQAWVDEQELLEQERDKRDAAALAKYEREQYEKLKRKFESGE